MFYGRIWNLKALKMKMFKCALGASLDGDAKLWFDHLEPGSITGYDMFTHLLKENWGRNIYESIEEQSGNDCL